MKYWKGRPGTSKEGQFGTMDDIGSVPDSDAITQIEYNSLVAAIPAPGPTQLETDISNLSISTLGDVTTKVKPILERIRKGER